AFTSGQPRRRAGPGGGRVGVGVLDAQGDDGATGRGRRSGTRRRGLDHESGVEDADWERRTLPATIGDSLRQTSRGQRQGEGQARSLSVSERTNLLLSLLRPHRKRRAGAATRYDYRCGGFLTPIRLAVTTMNLSRGSPSSSTT